MRKGEFSKPKMKGKRVLELGAGMGLGGIAFALLGAEVILTDTADVVPLLKRNCEYNLGTKAVQVLELGEEPRAGQYSAHGSGARRGCRSPSSLPPGARSRAR
jgi:predicted nicotinamide N-methyase